LAGTSAAINPESAARLFAATITLMSVYHIRLEPFNRPDFDHYLALTKRNLPKQALKRAWNQGVTMTLDEAVEYALAGESR
jgi:hypothetical protein